MAIETSAPAPKKRLMFHVTFHIADADVEEFLKHLQTAFETVTAEPECLYVDTYWDPNHHGTIVKDRPGMGVRQKLVGECSLPYLYLPYRPALLDER